jgi:hypothetical protein
MPSLPSRRTTSVPEFVALLGVRIFVGWLHISSTLDLDTTFPLLEGCQSQPFKNVQQDLALRTIAVVWGDPGPGLVVVGHSVWLSALLRQDVWSELNPQFP